MKAGIDPYGATGFGLAAAFAIAQKWSLPEFCWSTWLAGLVYAWSCAATASLQIILTARSNRAAYDERLPALRRISANAFLAGAVAVSVLVGWISFRLYGFLFGFYGLFLSVFAEMEPLALFGRNGFINSDFYTPVVYLLALYWPMALGALIANREDFIRKDPWKRIFLPFQQEILRMHVLTLALPLLALVAWALFGEAYQSMTIVLLRGLFYLLPRTEPKRGQRCDPVIDGRGGTMSSTRYRVGLLTVVLAFCVWSGIAPHDTRLTWVLETLPFMIALPVLLFTYGRFPLTNLTYTIIAVHAVILMLGGHYSYAKVPLGFWMEEWFGWTRNNYDKIGHFMQGFGPALYTREVIARTSPLKRGKWLGFISVAVPLAFSAVYEIIEWLASLSNPTDTEAFLGTQGYVWDTQSDMFFCLVGSIVALALLTRWHNGYLGKMHVS